MDIEIGVLGKLKSSIPPIGSAWNDRFFRIESREATDGGGTDKALMYYPNARAANDSKNGKIAALLSEIESIQVIWDGEKWHIAEAGTVDDRKMNALRKAKELCIQLVCGRRLFFLRAHDTTQLAHVMATLQQLCKFQGKAADASGGSKKTLPAQLDTVLPPRPAPVSNKNVVADRQSAIEAAIRAAQMRRDSRSGSDASDYSDDRDAAAGRRPVRKPGSKTADDDEDMHDARRGSASSSKAVDDPEDRHPSSPGLHPRLTSANLAESYAKAEAEDAGRKTREPEPRASKHDDGPSAGRGSRANSAVSRGSDVPAPAPAPAPAHNNKPADLRTRPTADSSDDDDGPAARPSAEMHDSWDSPDGKAADAHRRHRTVSSASEEESTEKPSLAQPAVDADTNFASADWDSSPVPAKRRDPGVAADPNFAEADWDEERSPPARRSPVPGRFSAAAANDNWDSD